MTESQLIKQHTTYAIALLESRLKGKLSLTRDEKYKVAKRIRELKGQRLRLIFPEGWTYKKEEDDNFKY